MHYFAGLLRCGKSCRLRWINYLRPDLKRGNITEEEDNLIIKLHSVLGNRWSLIAGRLPGRTDNEIKNYWNTHLKKKLKGMGVDPNTHQPLATSPSSSSLNVSPPTSSCNAQHQKLLISNNEVAMPGASCSLRRYNQLAANLQNHKLDGHEKSRMLIKSSSCTIDKYEIDRFLSSASAPISSVISSSTHFDYKAKPMFSLDCTAQSSAASRVSDTCGAAAATALVRVGSGSSFINIQARRTAAPLVGTSAAASSTPTCCSSGSSSSSMSSLPISKKSCGSLDHHSQYPYTLSPPLRSVVTPTPLSEFQASTEHPSSIHAFTKSPILYSSAQASTVHSTNAPLLESCTHVINSSPITTYISSHSSHPATYIKTSSPIRGESIDSAPSSNNFVCPSSSSFGVRSTNLAAYKLLYSDEADFMKNAWSSGDETLPRSPSEVQNEGAGAFAQIIAASGLNASTSLVTSNIACTQVVAEPTLCDQYMSDVIPSQMATSAALRMVAPPRHHSQEQNREVNGGHDQFHDVMEEGAELSNVAEKCLGEADIMMSSTTSGAMELGLLEGSSDDVMWDFEMGLQQSLEEGGHNIIGADEEQIGAAALDSQLPLSPTHQAEQQLLQGAHSLWGSMSTCNMSSSSCTWPLHMSSELPPQYHDHQQRQQLADYKPPKLINS
ncbi:hypothetical protein L7F22_047215 [Adiantum nelumboides]|nr:hypothetical protein [Adiantum nelumboides]